MEIRRSSLKNLWVIMAPERKGRGGDLLALEKPAPVYFQACPFCPGNEEHTPKDILTFSENGRWELRVFPNLYPALKVEGDLKRSAKGVYDWVSPIGAHEVVIYSSKHKLSMQEHTREVFYRLFAAVSERMIDLEKDFRFSYIDFFINKGYLAGGSALHPHGQILAMPILPQKVETELNASISHYKANKRCLCCDIIEYELSTKERIIMQSTNFVAFIQYASAVPFEVSIYPKYHDHDFMGISTAKVQELSEVMEYIFTKTGTVLNDPDFNMILYTSPTDAEIESDLKFSNLKRSYHWHIEVIPQLNRAGGAEISGVYINTVLPEEAAALLR